jgi:hypothetical protein
VYPISSLTFVISSFEIFNSSCKLLKSLYNMHLIMSFFSSSSPKSSP